MKRKLRSILTILGVVIGIASIVTMISLGLGMQKMQLEQIEQYGGLTSITVYPDDSSTVTSKSHLIDDDMIDKFSKMDHVELVSPVLTSSVILVSGVYQDYATVTGYSLDGLKALNYRFSKGSLPKKGDSLKFIYGNMILYDFSNSRTNMGYYDTHTLPDIDLMNDTVFTVFDTDSYKSTDSSANSENPLESSDSSEDSSEEGKTKTPAKKYIIPATGILYGEGEDDWYEYSDSIYCDIEALKTTLKKVYRGKTIPGQPTGKNGKTLKNKWYYSQAYVKVSDIKYVSDVQKKIKEMGYNASSNSEWIQQTQESSRGLAAMLGGIGAVSMLVAAIGIANTMMMSIYERTKEIGVMKVLGCELRDIQTLFLLEAGSIGLIGGIIGNLLSFIVAFTINRITGSETCYITAWLVFSGLLFAIIVGIIAGYFPSKRAMSLSPLAAIRNE